MGKCNCFDVKMELATDMEKRYLTVNKNGVLQLVGNYEVDVNVAGGGGGGKLAITNVFNPAYHKIAATINGMSYKTYTKLYADILFNLNCDINGLWKAKDTTYLTLSKYSRTRRKFVVLNDKKISDERFKLYCWAVTFSYPNDLDWRYFYTLDDYDSVEELVDADPLIWYSKDLDDLGRAMPCENGYATNIHTLTCNGLYISDYYDMSSNIIRYRKHDVDSYYVSIVGADPVDKWRKDIVWHGEEVPDDYWNKSNFLDWAQTDRALIKRRNHDKQKIVYRSYAEDYPIEPVKLSDCEILLSRDLSVKYFGEDALGKGDLWMRLGDLIEDDLQHITDITLKAPYNSNEILSRLYIIKSPNGHLERNHKDVIYAKRLCSANRRGGNYEVDNKYIDAGIISHLQLGLCSEENVRTGNFKCIQQFGFRMASYYSTARAYNYSEGDLMHVIISRIIH